MDNISLILESLRDLRSQDNTDESYKTIAGVKAEIDKDGKIVDEKAKKKIEQRVSKVEEDVVDEDKWITMRGTHVLLDDKGGIKNDNMRRRIAATSKKSNNSDADKSETSTSDSTKKEDTGKDADSRSSEKKEQSAILTKKQQTQKNKLTKAGVDEKFFTADSKKNSEIASDSSLVSYGIGSSIDMYKSMCHAYGGKDGVEKIMKAMKIDGKYKQGDKKLSGYSLTQSISGRKIMMKELADSGVDLEPLKNVITDEKDGEERRRQKKIAGAKAQREKDAETSKKHTVGIDKHKNKFKDKVRAEKDIKDMLDYTKKHSDYDGSRSFSRSGGYGMFTSSSDYETTDYKVGMEAHLNKIKKSTGFSNSELNKMLDDIGVNKYFRFK